MTAMELFYAVNMRAKGRILNLLLHVLTGGTTILQRVGRRRACVWLIESPRISLLLVKRRHRHMTLAFTVASRAEQHWGLTLLIFPLVTKPRHGYKPNNWFTQSFARLEVEVVCTEFVGPTISRTKMGIMRITWLLSIAIEMSSHTLKANI